MEVQSCFGKFENDDPMILNEIDKITFILFECHRSIDKSIDFHFLLLS